MLAVLLRLFLADAVACDHAERREAARGRLGGAKPAIYVCLGCSLRERRPPVGARVWDLAGAAARRGLPLVGPQGHLNLVPPRTRSRGGAVGNVLARRPSRGVPRQPVAHGCCVHPELRYWSVKVPRST